MNQNIIQQFIQITHCSQQQATRFLRMNNNIIQDAMNAFYESGEEPENAPVIQKPQPNNKVIEQMMDLTKTSREQATRYLMDNFNSVNEAADAFLESGEKPLNIIQEQPSEQTINEMIKLTNTSREQAIRFLMDNLNKVDEAANAFHDSGEKQLGNNPAQDNLWWEKQQREQKQREHYQQREPINEPINEKEEQYKPYQPKQKEQNKNVNKFFSQNNDLVKFQEILKTDYQTAQKYLKGNDFEKAVQNFQNDQKEEENRRKKLQEIEMQKQFENELMQQNQKEKKQRIDRNGQHQYIDQRKDNQYQSSTQFNEEKYNNGQCNNINSNAPYSMENECDQRNPNQNQQQEQYYYENMQNNTHIYTPKRNTNNNCDICGQQQNQTPQQQNYTENQQLDYETLQKQIEQNNILFQQLFGDQNNNVAVLQQQIPTVIVSPQNIQPIQQQTRYEQIQQNTQIQMKENQQQQDGNKSNSPSIIIESSESSSVTIDLESSDEQESKQIQSVFCLDETILNMSTQSQNNEKKEQYHKSINITLYNNQQTQQFQNQQINIQVNSSHHLFLFLEQKLNIKTFQFLVTQPQIIQVDQKEETTLIVKPDLFDQVNELIKQYTTIDSLADSSHQNANHETNNQTQNLPCYQLNKYNQIREQFGNFYAQIQRQNQVYENNVIIQKNQNEAPKLEATIELISENTDAIIDYQNSEQFVIKFNDNQAQNILNILNLQPEIVYRNQKQNIKINYE
ncbi:UBA-like_superfamily [Hexamita inflata]|uniref:UBA-like superfamily n=1 Tax=Hexamita inflata TaxID=28002 RepID=A0AA86UTR6_9EUKA|nr:UBA-like superfamily [Hexamita inflata]